MKTRKSIALFTVICGIFGTTFLAISLGLDAGASPLFFAGIRFTCAGLILFCIVLARGGVSRPGFAGVFPRLFALLPRSVLLSLFLTVGTFGCIFIAQTRVDSGFMARLDATGPLVTAALSFLFLAKRFNVLHALALILGTVGTLLIVVPGVPSLPSGGQAMLEGWPFVLMAIGSVIFYAAGNAVYPLLFASHDDPIEVSALQTLSGGGLLLVLSVITEHPVLPVAALGPLLYLILAGSVVAQTATLILVRDEGPVFASMWLYVAPPIASIAGALVRHEALAPGGLLGMILAMAGVTLMTWAESLPARSRYRCEPGA